MNGNDGKSPFSLSAACLAAGVATPLADRRERRSERVRVCLWLAAAAAVWIAAGPVAGIAAGSVAIAVQLLFRPKTGRRRRELWKTPFPPQYEKLLLRVVPHYRCLDEPGRELFRQRVKIFLEETAFHGAGTKATNGMRLRAAAAAVTPTLGFEEWEWPGLKEIIFRPDGYEHGSYQDGNGVVTEYEESGMFGDSGALSGSMMLSSGDLAWEFAHPEEGVNVGFHEFAHLMAAEGLVLAECDRGTWPELVKKESERIGRGDSLLDDYALLNEDEFFAVASELFFTVPRRLQRRNRELYAVLVRCYRQDPAAWLDAESFSPGRQPRRRKRRTASAPPRADSGRNAAK